MSHHASRDWLRLAGRVATLALCALAVATIPGSVIRPVVFERAPIPPPVTSEQRTTVTIVVRSGADQAPLARARVRALTVIADRAYVSGSGETSAGGRLELPRLPDAPTWFLVDRETYARASTQRVLSGGTVTIELDLVPAHHLSVTVKDDLGALLEGAEVEVAGGDPLPVGARADARGHAEVGRLAEGPWILSVHADGYEDATRVHAREGETPNVVLRKLGAIVVSVVLADDKPAPGARVQIAGSSLWPPRAADTTPDGTVRIGALAAGSYALRATRGSLVSPIELGVSIGRGEERRVVLKLVPGLYASARVVDGDGDDAAPVRGARVTLAEAGLSPFPLEATTDAKGRAHLGPVAPGPALLSAQADGFVPRGSIELPPDDSVATIVLVRAGVVEGRVVDARGRPVDGASVEIVGTSVSGSPIDDDPRKQSFRRAEFDATLAGPRPLVQSGELGVVPGPVPPIPRVFDMAATAGPLAAGGPSLEEPWVTRADGTFKAAPASPGRIRVLVHHPEFIEAMSDAVSLGPGGDVHVDIVLLAGGTLEGRVVDSGSRPVAGAHVVMAALHGPTESSTRTASDGTFAFAAVPKAVLVSASGDDETSSRVAQSTVDVAEGGKATLTLTLPDPRPPLEIHVRDDRGYPIGAAQISVGSVDPAIPFRTTAFTDARGDASVAGARGISLRLELAAPGYAGKAVSVDASATSADVTLGQAHVVTGIVRASRTGEPLAGAEVTLYTDFGPHRVEADHEGAFKIADVAGGPARMRVRAPGRVTLTRDLSIDDAALRPQDLGHIELGEEAAVEGTVVDARGDPVAGARVGKDQVPTYMPATGHVSGIATTDARGRFRLGELADGVVTVEAYAPDVGRAHQSVQVSAGKTTSGVVIHLGGDGDRAVEPSASGGVAVTLGEASGEPPEVVLVAVVDGSEAERAGLAQGDVVLSVDGTSVRTIAEARARLAGPLSQDVVVTRRRGDAVESVRVPREPVRR